MAYHCGRHELDTMPSSTCAAPWAWAASRRTTRASATSSRHAIEAVAVVFMTAGGHQLRALFRLPGGGGRWPCCGSDIEARTYLLGCCWSAVVLTVAAFLRRARRLPRVCRDRVAARGLQRRLRSPRPPGYATRSTMRSGRSSRRCFMLFLCSFATCAGSTGGGIKLVRSLLLLKQARLRAGAGRCTRARWCPCTLGASVAVPVQVMSVGRSPSCCCTAR
jgi:trk system potassium uptake protein TrkH